MLFIWVTKDHVKHKRFIKDREERLKFIEWLEYSKDVIWWR